MNVDLAALAPLAGRWDLRPELAVYLGPHPITTPAEFGLAIADDRFRMRSGRIRATVVFPDQPAEGRLVFGRDAKTNAYFSAGVGGHGFGYALSEFVPGAGWHALRTEGSEINLAAETPYSIEVGVHGQEIELFVDGASVLEGSLPNPMSGDQIGLFAWGVVPVHFRTFSADIDEPQATLSTPSRSVEDLIRQQNLGELQKEFDRALANVESDPPAAITAACAILESLFKVIIADKGLALPNDLSVLPLWKTVQAHLGWLPGSATDQFVRQILQGLASSLQGIAGLRSNVGSAHGQGPGAPRSSRGMHGWPFTRPTRWLCTFWRAPSSTQQV